MPALLKAVRQLVGADSAGFFWVDAQGDMTSLYAERWLPAAVMKLYFEHYYESGESSFRHAFIERAQASNPVIAVSPSSAVERSPYYNEVFRHLDAHHVLYGIVRAQGHALGQLSLYRPKSAQAFSAAQRSELSSIMHYVVHGVSQRGRIIAGTQAFTDSDDDVVFLIGHDGEIRQRSSPAHRLLTLATHGKLGREQIERGAEDKARPVLQLLAERLRLALMGGEVGPPCLILNTAWGRFVLRAYSISDPQQAVEGSIAIRIQRQEPTLLRFVEALGGLGLSPKQREVALGLAKGSSNREIATAMGVSTNTVAYHVKQLFQRLDTHDREQMIAKILVDGAQEP
jgi:DNA-binding CsgD family transcriptional regulator